MSFLDTLHMWHDFYVGMGIASAALLGFAFLGLSERSDRMNGHGGSHGSEGHTLGSLLGLVTVSLVVLIPGQSPKSLGLTLLATGVVGLALTARLLWRDMRGQLKHAGPAFLAWRIVLPLVVLLADILASIMLLVGARASGMESLYLLSAAFLILLLTAARNAWELLGRPGQEGLKLHKGSRG